MAKTAITVTDIRKAIDDQRKLFEKGLLVLGELESKLDGHESIGKEMKRVTAFFVDAWSRRYRVDYAHQGAKDATAVKRLLQTLTPEDIERRITIYLASSDPFIVRARHGLAVFASTINQHIPAALPLDEDDFQCQHAPRCHSAQQHTSKKLAEMRQ